MIEIDIDTRQVEQALNRLQQRTENLNPALDEIGAHIVSEIELNFRDTQDPYGNQWLPLKHRDGKQLNDTGRLKNSITHNVTHNTVEIGTNIEYAITHQLGAKKGQYGRTNRGAPIPWGDVPERPFLPTEHGGIPSSWEHDILSIITGYIDTV